MTARSSFLRKIYYIIGIAVLVVLLYIFGHPPTRGNANEKGDPGGILAQKQEKYKLSQTQLGEINPTAETVKLATLGLRGVAVLVLWEKSNDYKMKEDWAKYEATLKQIAVLQPHFINVWIHLAWNLSYNISVEFDNYRDRYHWVIRGIKYLQEGIAQNDTDPRLLWETGWTVSQKIGRADEHKQYRKLFKADEEFHELTSHLFANYWKAQRDNWLVGKFWYDDCIKVAEATGKRVKGKGPLIYNSSPAMCLMNYGEALEEEGTFGNVAKRAWKAASEAWREFGRKQIPEPDSDLLILGDLEKHEQFEQDFAKQLNDLEPGLQEKIRSQKLEALPPEQRVALDASSEKRNEKQQALAAQAEEQLKVTYEEIADRMPVAKKSKAKKLAAEARKHFLIALDIRRSRDVVNYDYWKLRAEVEQEDDTLEARKCIYEGTQMFRREADIQKSWELFNQGFVRWRAVLDKHGALIEDSLTGDDLMEMVNIYRQILHQRGESFPKPFILQDIVDKYDKKQ